ncbi:restriction endonuclease subunit S [Acinetobacter baumannii]|uniref:restriction endonuclease subunit S n=1 Tax=Acinetobacter baumannii TaxID=470 RepID=UPI003877956A
MSDLHLPKEWQIVMWSDLTSNDGFKRGPFGGSLKKECFVNKGYAVYEQYAPINDDCTRFRYFIQEDKFNELAGFSVNEGDFLISCSGTIGRITQVPVGAPKGIINQALLRIRLVKGKIDSDYFIKLFRSPSVQSQILNKTVGGTIQNLAAVKELKEIHLPLPPLAEQKIIADKLDTLLAQVESIKARLERIPEILKQLRQSVLAAAVSGKLTEEWREEEQLANWATTTLDSLILESANGLSKRTGVSGDEVTILRLADFKDAVRVHGNERVIKLDEKEKKKYALEKGDILIIRVNGSVDLAGRFIEYTQYDKMEGFCDHFIRIRLDTSRVNSTYLTYVANHGDGRHYLKNSLSTSAGQNTINQGSIKGLKLLLPSIQEQELVVSRVSDLFKYTVVIEEQVQSALDRVNNLTQSILAKAFRGELTAEWREANPELISGENSAEALLERIKAERSAKSVTKRGRGKA